MANWHSKPSLQLLLPPTNSSFSSSYGSWDNRHGPPPTVHFAAPLGPDGLPIPGASSTEQMASALVYAKVQIYLPPNRSGPEWKAAAARALAAAAKRGSRNVVLDMTEQSALWQEAPKKP